MKYSCIAKCIPYFTQSVAFNIITENIMKNVIKIIQISTGIFRCALRCTAVASLAPASLLIRGTDVLQRYSCTLVSSLLLYLEVILTKLIQKRFPLNFWQLRWLQHPAGSGV